MKRGRLSDLRHLAELVRDRDLKKVERILQHRNRLEADVAKLRDLRRMRQGDGALDTARLSGADVAWEAWCDSRIARTQDQIALLRVEHEVAMNEARRAFGRADAMRQLAERQTKTGR